MPEYINPNLYAVYLVGPDGRTIRVNKGQRIVLSEYFDRYKARGFLKSVNERQEQIIVEDNKPIKRVSDTRTMLNQVSQDALDNVENNPNAQIKKQQTEREAKLRRLAKSRNIKNQQIKKTRTEHEIELQRTQGSTNKIKFVQNSTQKIMKNTKMKRHVKRPHINYVDDNPNRRVVGRISRADANELLQDNIKNNNYPISNGIGVGILSYNRPDVLHRLIRSIVSYTNLQQTTIFISDDASDDSELVSYLAALKKSPNFVILRNNERLGIAGNTNRLLRCLKRFDYGIILNDDVEIVQKGWDEFYVDAMKRTGFHHFMYNQVGVYNAKPLDTVNVNGHDLLKIDKRPQGAVLAFSNKMMTECGYFDESYGLYGMEHVDWSSKSFEFGLQPAGFFDIAGANQFFTIHPENSAVENRQELLHEARKVYETRKSSQITPVSIEASKSSAVPIVTYVVPLRNFHRKDEIVTVLDNIRAQRFPQIEIIVVEQDAESNIDVQSLMPARYFHADGNGNPLFNKAVAFNVGMSNVQTKSVILHDADMIVPAHYTRMIYSLLKEHDACHVGSKVLYVSKETTSQISVNKTVDEQLHCDRVVTYYEGGSLACNLNAYWKIGGFNEDFWGYGCEDCDFYSRLEKGVDKFYGERSLDLLHLWHPRVEGWDDHHQTNKKIEQQLTRNTIEQRIAMQHEQLRRNGYGDNLDNALKG